MSADLAALEDPDAAYVERARRRVLVSAEELATAMGSASAPSVLDVRRGPEPAAAFAQGHLPGAALVDLDTELTGAPDPARGRRPLPALDDLLASAHAWGLRDGRPVVVYDHDASRAAARAWWLLRWAGVGQVRILDGGSAAWVRAGGQLETGASRAVPGDVTLPGGRLPVMDAEEVSWWPLRGVLLDARSSERYRGEVEPRDARAGHVPGAVSAPAATCLDAHGAFLPASRLLEHFKRLGVARASYSAVYSGSGIAACLLIAALASVGQPAVLYPGSWSQWAADPQRPVATGA